mgnify:CR=1 FL=1
MRNNYKKIQSEVKAFVERFNQEHSDEDFLKVSNEVENYIEKNYPDIECLDAGCGFGVRNLEFYKNSRFVMEILIDCETKQVIDPSI